MTEQNPDKPMSEPAKSGRGPTRPEVKFADLVTDLKGDEDVLAALRNGGTAKEMRECAKQHRSSAKENERDAARCDADAAILARVEELPEALRKALLVVLTPEEK